MGGFAAAWVGFSFALPPVLHMLVAIVFAALAGLAWIVIPAYFRARYNANEVVSTILANYVAVLITSYLTINIFKRAGRAVRDAADPPSAYLPEFFSFSRLNWGLIIGLALAVGDALLLPAHGARLRDLEMGANPKFAEYGGIDIKRQGFFVLLASGAVGGLAGGIEALGVHHRFMEGFAPGFGFDGVIAALLANGSPLGTIVTALFFGALRNGSLLLEVDTTASREIITVVQALIILAVSAQITIRRSARRQHCRGAPVEVLERLFNVSLIVATLRTTTPILLVALGGSFTTKAGIFNIGLEGQMLVGAFFAVIGTIFFGSPWIGVLCGVLAALVLAYVFALLVVTYKANEVVVGLALNILAGGITISLTEGDLRHPRLDLRSRPSRTAERSSCPSCASSAGSAR